MKEFKDFNTEKSIYIGKVLEHIHYKKLHTRIYEELSAHLDDMYGDFSTECDDEKEITKRVFEEMGHPHYLGLELKKANRTKLFWARLFKFAICISAIPLMLFSIVLISNICSELSTYFHATDIETKEMQIVEEYNNNEPIHLLAEIEDNGIVYRYYLPDKRPENNSILFNTQSIKVFDTSVKDKFLRYGYQTGPDDNEMLLNIGNNRITHDHLWVLYGKTGPKYVKRYYEPIDTDSGLEPYWSDFIEIPQYGTYENPVIIYVQSPEGYTWSTFQTYDENKEKYIYPGDDKQNYHSTIAR